MEVSLVDYPSITESTSLTVIIEPCQVTQFTGSVLPENSFSYQVQASETTAFTYSFTQVALCDYEQTIEIVDLPAFMSHDESTKQLRIFTDNPQDDGDYTLVVKSTIQDPTNGPMTAEIALQVSV